DLCGLAGAEPAQGALAQLALNRVRSLLGFPALLLAAMFTSPARADLPDEIQVYDDSLNRPGQFGLEIQTNHSFGGETRPSFPGEIVSGNATRLTAEFSYGLGGRFEAGMYLDFVVPNGEPLEF